MSGISSNSVVQTASKGRFPRWFVIVGVIAVVALVAFTIMTLRMNAVPADLDTSSTRLTEEGGYEISYEPGLTPIPINQIQTWTIRLTQPDGHPVEDAEITVDGGMPQHGHGLPTAPQVTDYLGDGVYRVEGMKFNMPGWWVITFEVAHNGTTDQVTFNLILN